MAGFALSTEGRFGVDKLKIKAISLDLVVAGAFAILCSWLAYKANGNVFGIDDADIFFTYAKNLATGKGIIYSQGIPAVEGYTSTLWMGLCSLIFFAGSSDPGVMALALILFASSQFVVLRMLSQFFSGFNSLLAKALYLSLVAASFGYVSWTTVTLMDTGLWSFLLIWIAYLLLAPKGPTQHPTRIVVVPFALAALTRPEALLIVPSALVLLGVTHRQDPAMRKQLLLAALAFVIATAGLIVFRLAYFGYPLPNTYYAKVAPSRAYNLHEGWKYLDGYLESGRIAHYAVLLTVGMALGFAVKLVHTLVTKRPAHIENSWFVGLGRIAWLTLAVLATPLATGGDHFNLHRFYQPIYPLLVLLLVVSLIKLLEASQLAQPLQIGAKPRTRILAFVVTVVGVAAVLIGSEKLSWRQVFKSGSPIGHEFLISRKGRALGAKLEELFDAAPRPANIGVLTAGGIARTYRGSIYDLMGLNNAFLAHFPGERIGIKNHAAFEKAVFYQLPVELITESPDDDFVDIASKGLFKDERFVREWTFGKLTATSNPQKNHESFYRKEFVEGLVASGIFTFVPTRVFSETARRWN